MKRRTFGLMAGTSLAALKLTAAKAQTAGDPALLTSTLTPIGGERAGNADGSIPAWTGGYTTLPAGWQVGQPLPDFFASDAMVVEIDASNMAQYAAKLNEGTTAMMTKYGLKIKVYPTHRTALAPQWVYDNIAKNAVNAKLSDPAYGGAGFSGAYGGIPFPIPDTSQPLVAGAQIIWNHCCRWQGTGSYDINFGYVMENGNLILSDHSPTYTIYPYYDKNGSLDKFDGWLQLIDDSGFTGPANLIGEQAVEWFSTNPGKQPTQAWELLQGQGRVRKEPELQYDTPSSFADGLTNYDEYYGFLGSPDEYDWKCLGKKEMYVPYNDNAIILLPASAVMLPHFPDPEVVRWELHRVWVVEATVHPGKRNVMARRMVYFDEDTWTICLADEYDANNNLYHTLSNYLVARPDMPGTCDLQVANYNLQTNNYAMPVGLFNEKAVPTYRYYDTLPASQFDPENMAASAQY